MFDFTEDGCEVGTERLIELGEKSDYLESRIRLLNRIVSAGLRKPQTVEFYLQEAQKRAQQ